MMMPERLAARLPGVPPETLAKLFGSLAAVSLEPRESPIREGVILAYDDVMKWMCIAATLFGVPSLLMAFFMPNWHLGDSQNAVEGVDLAGNLVGETASTESSHSDAREKSGDEKL